MKFNLVLITFFSVALIQCQSKERVMMSASEQVASEYYLKLKETLQFGELKIEFQDSFEGRGPAHPENPDAGGEAGFPLVILVLSSGDKTKRQEFNEYMPNEDQIIFEGVKVELLEMTDFKTTERWGGRESGATKVKLKLTNVQ